MLIYGIGIIIISFGYVLPEPKLDWLSELIGKCWAALKNWLPDWIFKSISDKLAGYNIPDTIIKGYIV